MDFVYNVNSKKVIDGDIIPLNTLKDLEKEIDKVYAEIFAQRESVEKTISGVSDEKGLKRWKDTWEKRKSDFIKERRSDLKKFERILESLLSLKRSRFG